MFILYHFIWSSVNISGIKNFNVHVSYTQKPLQNKGFYLLIRINYTHLSYHIDTIKQSMGIGEKSDFPHLLTKGVE
jgi:hypothetical protein